MADKTPSRINGKVNPAYVHSLEANLKTHQDYIAQMMARQGYGSVIDGTDEPTQGLDAASTAVVNSLLCSVPESKFYRDDD